ncbi:unnamed protein product [Ectocarpus sp. CCAP 1310/34]|nr:unnamed protein product [Ectocarpus sp. CCAP 1310/34]
MLAALACELNLDLCHFDVEQAFVRSELEEDVYMRLPQGCGALSGMIVKLGKSLYGLRQASRQWHAMLKRCLVALGFEQCMADACVFRLIEDVCVVLILVVQVDDIFAVGERERCDKYGADLNKSVPVKNLGELRWYSGCFYERNKETGRLTISQQTFTDELAAEYGVVGGRSVPMSSGVKLSDFDADEVATEFPFRELGAIQLAQNPISNSNSKHIDVRHHFLRELVERKEISVIHVPSPYQRADFLTKSMSKDAFESHRDLVMNLG